MWLQRQSVCFACVENHLLVEPASRQRLCAADVQIRSSQDEQALIGHIFNALQGRSNAEWFGDKEKKASLGRFKVMVSTHGFVSEMHRRVQV